MNTPDQPELPMTMPDTDTSLHAAYQASAVRHQMTFAEAMAHPAIALGLRNTAEAMRRRAFEERQQ